MTLTRTISAIFVKDILSEFRTGRLLPTMILFALLTAWVFRVAVESAGLDKSLIAPAVLLVVLLFSAILSADKSFAVEHENDCISALLLAAADPGDIYIAKLMVNITVLSVFELVTVPAVLVLFDLSARAISLHLAVVLLLVNIAIAGAGTFLGPIAGRATAAGGLSTILVMAVLSPIIVPAVFSLLILFHTSGGAMSMTGIMALVGDFPSAVGFLAAFDAIFVTVCWLLFGFVIAE
ncbi:MAG TPA: heme exporter protein CcmB [Sedimentisphaerales bacterium]|nr:heme exporter protein CcmB [Sedimentisphaerales bacterium]